MFVISGNYLWARVLFPLFSVWALLLAVGIDYYSLKSTIYEKKT